MGENRPLAGGGGDLRNISAVVERQIQQVASRYGVAIFLEGSRAAGTSGPASDFDYVIEARHRVRNSAKYFLPRGPRLGEGAGIDIFSGPLDRSRPHILFLPDAGISQDMGGE